MTTTERKLTLEEQAAQRVERRATWNRAMTRAAALVGKTDRQSVIDVLHDDAKRLDVGRWFATLPACEQLAGCDYPATTDPWEKPPTHGPQCARGQAIAARWGRL